MYIFSCLISCYNTRRYNGREKKIFCHHLCNIAFYIRCKLYAAITCCIYIYRRYIYTYLFFSHTIVLFIHELIPQIPFKGLNSITVSLIFVFYLLNYAIIRKFHKYHRRIMKLRTFFFRKRTIAFFLLLINPAQLISLMIQHIMTVSRRCACSRDL